MTGRNNCRSGTSVQRAIALDANPETIRANTVAFIHLGSCPKICKLVMFRAAASAKRGVRPTLPFTATCDATEPNRAPRSSAEPRISAGVDAHQHYRPFPKETSLVVRINRESQTLKMSAKLAFAQPGMGMDSPSQIRTRSQSIPRSLDCRIKRQPIAKPGAMASTSAASENRENAKVRRKPAALRRQRTHPPFAPKGSAHRIGGEVPAAKAYEVRSPPALGLELFLKRAQLLLQSAIHSEAERLSVEGSQSARASAVFSRYSSLSLLCATSTSPENKCA